MMNPFDTMNNTTKQNNTGKSRSVKSANRLKKITSHKTDKSKPSKQRTRNLVQVKHLKAQYSTVRLNMYDTLRLKILQAVTGKKSRSDLVNDMIRIVTPVYLNSSERRQKYTGMLNYVIEGLKMKNKFNHLK